MVQHSHSYMTTRKTKNIASTIRDFAGKVMSLLFNIKTVFFFLLAFFFFPIASLSGSTAQLVKNPPAMQETLVPFVSQENPLEKE